VSSPLSILNGAFGMTLTDEETPDGNAQAGFDPIPLIPAREPG
jgi:hypothetical protein